MAAVVAATRSDRSLAGQLRSARQHPWTGFLVAALLGLGSLGVGIAFPPSAAEVEAADSEAAGEEASTETADAPVTEETPAGEGSHELAAPIEADSPQSNEQMAACAPGDDKELP